jgi:hypothetical protein
MIAHIDGYSISEIVDIISGAYSAEGTSVIVRVPSAGVPRRSGRGL